eukprot:scaffold8374_cov175-Amphora_coffeaeformis.AAC.56
MPLVGSLQNGYEYIIGIMNAKPNGTLTSPALETILFSFRDGLSTIGLSLLKNPSAFKIDINAGKSNTSLLTLGLRPVLLMR